MGSAFIRYLLLEKKFGGRVINYDVLTYAGDLSKVEEVSNFENYFFVKGDISNKFLLEEVIEKFQIDTIVHFAAQSHVDTSINKPLEFVRTNILGTVTLLELAKKHSKKIHFHHTGPEPV